MTVTIKKPTPFISGSMLKLLAMLTMFIDHLASYILSSVPFCINPFLSVFGKGISVYFICRLIGRLAFPLYCFLLTEGFLHTKNRKSYAVRLFVFALISELPWNFAHTGRPFCSSQNVMFTLFFGYLALCAVEYLSNDLIKQFFALIALFFVCSFSAIDFGARGLGLILIIYLLRNKPIYQAVASGCILPNGWAAIFAFIPINLYNGERGFMKGAFGKYVGYLFYPVHLLILGIIKYLVL